jgi:hypothetical protein
VGDEWEWAYALAGDDAEGFAVYCVASSEDLVEHTRQCDFLVTLSACAGGRKESRFRQRAWMLRLGE